MQMGFVTKVNTIRISQLNSKSKMLKYINHVLIIYVVAPTSVSSQRKEWNRAAFLSGYHTSD